MEFARMHTINSQGASRPIGRRERRSIETREKILRSAINLFAKRGFNATTIDAITESADIGKGTFFNYFENKESILLEYQKMQTGRVSAFVTESIDSDEPLLPLIYKLAVTLAADYAEMPTLYRSIIVAISSGDAGRAMAEGDKILGRGMLPELIKKRQLSGEIRPDLSAKAIAKSLHRVLLGTILLWSFAPNRTLKEELRETVKIFVNGIQTK